MLDDFYHLIRELPSSAGAEKHVAVLRNLVLLERHGPLLCAPVWHRPPHVALVGPSLREKAAPRRVAAISAPPAQRVPTHCDAF